jgi:hypothetical protein
MKRENNLYQRICSIENLMLADIIARRGKLNKPEILEWDQNREPNILKLHEELISKTY